MGAVMDLFSGSVRAELTCRYAERAANICAANRVDFRDMKRTGERTTELTVNIPDYRRLRRLARETGSFEVRAVRRQGAPFFLWRLRRRYALLAGLLVCAALLGLSTLFVWQIEVTGNETVPTTQILAALKEEGVDIGTCILNIKNKWVSNSVLLRIPELSFITLNSQGSRIRVVVREKTPRPALVDPDVPAAVEARTAGVIVRMEVEEGWALCAVGETVDAGDTLISPWTPLGNGRMSHARARVWARTWHELSLQMPLETVRKTYTGEVKTRTAVILGGKRINFYISGGNPQTNCDKIVSYTPVTLPGGAVMPLTVVRERFEMYETVTDTLSEAEAEAVLRARLLAVLEERIGEGSVTATQFTSHLDGGILTVTLNAECVEEIASERLLTDEEAESYKTAS